MVPKVGPPFAVIILYIFITSNGVPTLWRVFIPDDGVDAGTDDIGSWSVRVW